IRSGPTSRGSSYRIGTPVETPGPTTSSSAPAQRSANAAYSRSSCGTVVESTIPSSASTSTKARSITASSSLVCRGSVATRNCSVSRASSNRPKTVCVLPTSIARSRRALRGRRAERAVAVAHPLRERLGRERRLLALGAELLDGHVGRGVDLDARDHPGRAVLVPDPDVLHLELGERVRRLGHVLQVEPVAEVRRL